MENLDRPDNPDWTAAQAQLDRIRVSGNDSNAPVTIEGDAEGLHCIGIGTDAAVFASVHVPGVAFKLFSPHAEQKIDTELGVYRMLGDSPYFARCYGRGDRFLAVSLEHGTTLLDCLLRGIPIPRQAMRDVDDARAFVRSVGLNPRDIHFKNVLLRDDGRAVIVDVSEYVQPGDDKRWEHLAWAYDRFYSLLEGVSIPLWVVSAVKQGYKLWANGGEGNLEDFSERIGRLFFRGRQ